MKNMPISSDIKEFLSKSENELNGAILLFYIIY